MKILFIHQYFPGQFRHIAPYLHSLGHEIRAICSHQRPIDFSCQLYRYSEPASPGDSVPGFGANLWVEALQRSNSVIEQCKILILQGWVPDRICAHSGWGETLGLREIWPNVPQIIWPELWLRPSHGGFGLDPLKPPDDLNARLEHLGRNSLTRCSLSMADSWIMPTLHQANSLPVEYKDNRLHIIHEGIDVDVARPNSDVSFEVRGFTISSNVPTITFVNRNLERLRGFDTFMEALPLIQREHPSVRVLIVGDDKASYGGVPDGKERLLARFHSSLDLERIHFLGRIPYPQLIGILQLVGFTSTQVIRSYLVGVFLRLWLVAVVL